MRSCLTLAVFVVAFYLQGPPVLASAISAGGDPGALGPLAVVNDAGGRWRETDDTNKESADFEPPKSPATDRNATCPQCACGALGKKLGIVGGYSTYVDEYPWMALLLFKDKSKTFCGGSLINNKYVLTAAHCVERKRENIIVRLLAHYRNTTTEEKSKDYKVLEVIIHELWSRSEKVNDIALLRLDNEVIFSPDSRIHPVCLPVGGNSFDGYEGVVTGWGYTNDYGGYSNVLQQVNVPIISNKKCNAWTDEDHQVTDTMMCTGYLRGGKNPCHGDSGGPLHIRNKSVYYVVGIVSRKSSFSCARPRTPVIYTRVNKYLDWLADNTKNACACNNVNKTSTKRG